MLMYVTDQTTELSTQAAETTTSDMSTAAAETTKAAGLCFRINLSMFTVY